MSNEKSCDENNQLSMKGFQRSINLHKIIPNV